MVIDGPAMTTEFEDRLRAVEIAVARVDTEWRHIDERFDRLEKTIKAQSTTVTSNKLEEFIEVMEADKDPENDPKST